RFVGCGLPAVIRLGAQPLARVADLVLETVALISTHGTLVVARARSTRECDPLAPRHAHPTASGSDVAIARLVALVRDRAGAWAVPLHTVDADPLLERVDAACPEWLARAHTSIGEQATNLRSRNPTVAASVRSVRSLAPLGGRCPVRHGRGICGL